MSTNHNDKCRLCFTPGLFHINLFKTTRNVIESIREIFRTEVDESDQLPNFICVDCWLTMKKFYKFYQNVLSAQNKYLLEIQPQIKVEYSHEEPAHSINYVCDPTYESQHFPMADAFDGIQPHIEHNDDGVLVEEFSQRNTSHADDYDYDADYGYDPMDYASDFSSQDYSTNGYGKEKELSQPVKRKRGRPRKIRDPNAPIEAKDPSVKRKRGRPRKVHPPNDVKLEYSLDNTFGTNSEFDVSNLGNGSGIPGVKRKRGRPRKVPDSDNVNVNVNVDESHETVDQTEYQDTFSNSDNETSEFDAMGMVVTDEESGPNFQKDGKSESESSDDYDDDDVDEYTPAKAYKRKTLSPQPKRKRGRPRKIRPEPVDVPRDASGKRMNWREGKVFKCPYCPKKFTRHSRIAVHIKLQHGFECEVCNIRLPSEQKLQQHAMVHEDGFEVKLRETLEEIGTIDVNDISQEERDAMWNQFDRTCDNCPIQFDSLNEAQVHYLNAHNISRGYVKCCEMKFREDLIIKEHMAYHKNPAFYTCFICNTTIKVKSYFRGHMKNHVNELLEVRKYKCDLCDKQFTAKSNLLYHVAEVHNKQKFECEICSRVLFTQAQKNKHIRNAHETMSQQDVDFIRAHFDMSCDKCDAMFETYAHAKRHYLSEHGEPKGYIKCCDKKMRDLATIDDHIQWHKNPELLRCEICDKEFKFKDHLKSHVRRHGKTFTCEICGKSFKRMTTLMGHRKALHESGPKEFHCRFCSLRFISDEKRNVHEQLIHYGNTTGARHVCDICGRGFLQASHLHKHFEAHHSDDPQKRAKKEENKSEMCTICGLWLRSRYRLKLHRKCHSMEPNRCQECGLEAPNHEALLGHIRAFHEVRQKNKCRLCHQIFSTAEELHEHAATHSTDKLYQCAFCPDSFVWRASLDCHMKKLHAREWEASKATENNENTSHSITNSFDQVQKTEH